jgi:hypothetical protein
MTMTMVVVEEVEGLLVLLLLMVVGGDGHNVSSHNMMVMHRTYHRFLQQHEQV